VAPRLSPCVAAHAPTPPGVPQRYWIESVNLYAGDCSPGCESQCAPTEGVCSFKVEVWTGPATTLQAAKTATTGWVTAGHSHPGTITQSVSRLNVPPVRTQYVKLVVEQAECPSLSHAAVVNELQVIQCPLCLTVPDLPNPAGPVDPDSHTDAPIDTYGHTLVGFWALDDHTLRDFVGDHDGHIVGNVVVTRDPARGPVLEFFGTPSSYVQVDASPAFDLNTYSVMFWVKAYQLNRKQAIFAHGESFGDDANSDDDNTDKAQYIIFMKEDGHIQHWSESAGEDQGSGNAHRVTATDFYSSSDFQLRLNDWVHVSVTRGEDNAVMFYVNGELDSHHNPEAGFNDPHIQHILTFGARTNWHGRPVYQDWFAGMIDDIRLFSVEVGLATIGGIYMNSAKVMCDDSALMELTNGVNHMCCDDPDIPTDCSAGVPSECSVDCAEAFLPLWRNCGDELGGSNAAFAPFADACAATQQEGAVSQCGYTELLPIMLDCTHVAGDFCSSACYAHLMAYTHACYHMMPPAASNYLQQMASQTDTCNGAPGDGSTDLGESCDIYSIQHACSVYSIDSITAAIQAEANCDEDEHCDEAPELEALCESQCAQELLGSYDTCSQEGLIDDVFEEHCTGTLDVDGNGVIDIDDEECTDRGADNSICDYAEHQCPGPCTGAYAPEICDEHVENGPNGPCQNGARCVDATHNTAFLPTDPDTEEVLLPEGNLMCACESPYSGRFCSCTSFEEIVNSCTRHTKKDQCNDALGLMAGELQNICSLSDLKELGNSQLQCSLGCANLFSPFYSTCGGELWPTVDAGGDPLPTSGPAYQENVARGVDAVFNSEMAAFNQRCAVAGGRPDGQADYCTAQPCESCHASDGCGWCSGRNVCSNECTSTRNQCETTHHNHVDACATVVDCEHCNAKPSCGWCQDGTRHVCSGSCAVSSTVAECDAYNQHIHDGAGGHIAPPPPATGTGGSKHHDACGCVPGTGWDAHPAPGLQPACRSGSVTSPQDAAMCLREPQPGGGH
jgi:hypothetical protein